MRFDSSALFLLIAVTTPAICADYSFTGTFTSDDQSKSFRFTLSNAGTVVLRTYSYAGGVNSAGQQIPAGGFDTTLSLFDATGNLIAVNRDGGCDNVAKDSVTSSCWDAYVQTSVPAGTYQLVLTQSDNLPNGPTLADSFAYDGAGNFTADPEAPDQQGFWDFFPSHRTGSWAVDISGVDGPATPIDPSNGPATIGVVNSGSFQTGSTAANTIMTLMAPGMTIDSSVAVTLDGTSLAVLYAGGSQINFVIPQGVSPEAGAVLKVSRGNAVLVSTAIDVTDASPALFTSGENGTGQAAVINQKSDGSFSYNGSQAPTQPAARGDWIQVYGTGFGPATQDASGLYWSNEPVTATIGGMPVQVEFAGLAPGSTSGLEQVNLQIPADCPTGPAIPIRIQVGTHLTQAGTTVAVQ